MAHDTTRYARTVRSLDPERSTEGTHLTRPPRASRPPASLFASVQRELWSAIAEVSRPGLMVFSVHPQLGVLGRLWLAATETPRVGTVGRHDLVDLALPLDEGLSLRHLAFVVHLHAGQVQFSVVDLGTPGGLHTESGVLAARVDATGPCFLRASDFTFCCFPTGRPPPWSRDVEAGAPLSFPRAPARVVSPHAAGAPHLRGWLSVDQVAHPRTLELHTPALERGVLIGRADRCALQLEDDAVSRVHAAVLLINGTPWLLDTGSTNGLWCRDREVQSLGLCEPVTFFLGPARLRWTGIP